MLRRVLQPVVSCMSYAATQAQWRSCRALPEMLDPWVTQEHGGIAQALNSLPLCLEARVASAG